MTYINAVIHESFFEIVNNCRLNNLLQKNHIFHSALFDIVALPVVRLVFTKNTSMWKSN